MNLYRIKDKLNYHKLITRISDSIESDAEALIKKQKPDLSEEEVNTFINALSKFKKPKHKKLAVHWFLQESIKLPEDHSIVEKAIQFAENKKLDPMAYDNPRELSEQLLDKSINPDKIPQFTNKKVLKKYNITIYDVEDSPAGQQAVRDIINSQYGLDRNPWCIIQAKDGVLTEKSYNHWKIYDKTQRRIAFLDGKAIAFSANNSPIEAWWDINDNPHNGIPLPTRKEGDTTITEKINHEGVIIETKKKYKTGKSDLIVYWPNGNPKKEETIEEGTKERVTKEWHENGKLKSSYSYENGQLQGPYKEWYDNGQSKTSYFYKNGAYDGLCQSWYENGQLKASYNYENGQPQGLYQSWYENGQIKSSLNYEERRWHGLCQRWYENGQLESSHNYKNGKMYGLCQEWHENGELKWSRNYNKGK